MIILEYFANLNPIYQALIATTFTWFITALGAFIVCFFKKINNKLLDTMLGFAAGVMIAASFWSLLAPAIELSGELGHIQWLYPSIGFIGGGIFVILADKFLDKMLSKKINKQSPKQDSWRRSILLVSAVTLHNIPEGLAVGVAFGALAFNIPGATLIGAVLLALGIGLQNFPEGAAVSLPLRREGYPRRKCFLFGQASGLVEPVAGIIGVLAALMIRSMLPFLLAFSAGAMIVVCASELLPEACKKNKNLACLGVVVGFTFMMVLDVALG